MMAERKISERARQVEWEKASRHRVTQTDVRISEDSTQTLKSVRRQYCTVQYYMYKYKYFLYNICRYIRTRSKSTTSSSSTTVASRVAS
jgi:hypothetical protein